MGTKPGTNTAGSVLTIDIKCLLSALLLLHNSLELEHSNVKVDCSFGPGCSGEVVKSRWQVDDA